MKKSSLTTAVLAGLAGVVGFAGSAGAVNLNPDGTGQVLVYPYYTTHANQDTLFSIVNTTGIGKAVKVRMLEGYDSQEVLDFNLFLSPYDVWVAEITDYAGRAGISTNDASCTWPRMYGETHDGIPNGTLFRDTQYTVYSPDGGPTDAARQDEGYMVAITMANVVAGSDTATAIDHSVLDCKVAALDDPANPDFVSPTDYSSIDGGEADGSGGLFGNAQIVNVEAGFLYAYTADAVDGFLNRKNFHDAGTSLPNLASASWGDDPTEVTASVVLNGASTELSYSDPIDAVSAVFQASALMNEWVAEPANMFGSDWVVTFPTKSFYVAPYHVKSSPEPFEDFFDEPGVSCAMVGYTVWNREEIQSQHQSEQDFSPAPPAAEPSSLCTEVNVLTFGGEDSVLHSKKDFTYGVKVDPSFKYTSGWLHLDLNPKPGSAPHELPAATNNGIVLEGLPATGFWAERILQDTGRNYTGTWRHRVERTASQVETP